MADILVIKYSNNYLNFIQQFIVCNSFNKNESLGFF